MVADARIYLGRPGALAAIRSPRGSFEATRQRRISSFELGAGGFSVDQMIGGARAYTINYDQLFRDDWTTLQAFLDGHEGPGPFVLLDPGQRNMLPANIAAATSVTNSPSGAGAPVGGFSLLGVDDDYNRAPVASGWGTARSGQAWSVSPASGHAITGTTATQTVGAVNSLWTATIETGSTDFDLIADMSLPLASAATAPVTQWVCGRYTDANNYYTARLTLTTTGAVQLAILRRSGGTLSSALGPGTVAVGAGHVSGDVWRIEFVGTGTGFAAYAWMPSAGSRPSTPQVTVTDATLTTGTLAALMTRLETGNTNTTPVVSTWDNFSAAAMWGALTSSGTYSDAGPRTLALTFSAAPATGGAIVPDWPSSTFGYGVPVVAGRAVCLSCWVRGGGGDPIATYTPQILWRDTTGAVVSVTTGTPVASAAASFAQMFAQGVPPATAAYADFGVLCTSGASIGTIAYFRRFMLNEGTTPDASWAAGTGVWPVRMVSGVEAWPFQSPELRTGAVVSFVEDVS